MEVEAAKMIGAGLASIALVGAGVGIGIIFGNYLQGALRNPSAAPTQFAKPAARLCPRRGDRPVRPGGGVYHPVRLSPFGSLKGYGSCRNSIRSIGPHSSSGCFSHSAFFTC